MNDDKDAGSTNQQNPQDVQPKEKLSIWRVAGTILSLALLVYLVLTQGWESFLEVLKRIPSQYFWISIGLVVLSRFFVTLRWFILLRTAGVQMKFPTCLRLVFMGLFASNFLPSTVGGDLVRLAGAVYLRLDAAVSAASLLVDRLVGMAGMACFLPFGLAIVAQPLSAAQSVSGKAIAAGVFSVSGLKKLWARIRKFLLDLLHSAGIWLRKPSSLFLALLCTFGHQLCTYLIVWLFLKGMQQDVSLFVISGLWSLSYFFSLVPVSINGLGLQEVSITYLFTHFAGVPMQAGLALALLLRMLFMLISLPGVMFLPDILRPLKKK